MSYTSGSHTVFHHRYHIVWITKYRYKVLEGALRERIRTIIRQVCRELGVQIVSGVLSREHVHMFVEIPPHIAVSDFVRRVKGRSSHRVQMEFPDLRKRYWGRHFWARGYFSTTSGNITDDVILQYLQQHEQRPIALRISDRATGCGRMTTQQQRRGARVSPAQWAALGNLSSTRRGPIQRLLRAPRPRKPKS